MENFKKYYEEKPTINKLINKRDILKELFAFVNDYKTPYETETFSRELITKYKLDKELFAKEYLIKTASLMNDLLTYLILFNREYVEFKRKRLITIQINNNFPKGVK